jgi:hypothetical protein
MLDFIYCCAECRHAESHYVCHYAECCYGECCGTDCSTHCGTTWCLAFYLKNPIKAEFGEGPNVIKLFLHQIVYLPVANDHRPSNCLTCHFSWTFH